MSVTKIQRTHIYSFAAQKNEATILFCRFISYCDAVVSIIASHRRGPRFEYWHGMLVFNMVKKRRIGMLTMCQSKIIIFNLSCKMTVVSIGQGSRRWLLSQGDIKNYLIMAKMIYLCFSWKDFISFLMRYDFMYN